MDLPDPVRQQALGGSLEKGGFFLQISLMIFLISRFLMTWVIGRSARRKVLAVLAVLAVLLCLFAMSSPNLAGVIAVVSLSFCLSLMFPTIYGVALRGLGPATKFGAAGLVMAIVGGAIMPLVQGEMVDATSAGVLVHRPGCLLRGRRARTRSTTCGPSRARPRRAGPRTPASARSRPAEGPA